MQSKLRNVLGNEKAAKLVFILKCIFVNKKLCMQIINLNI